MPRVLRLVIESLTNPTKAMISNDNNDPVQFVRTLMYDILYCPYVDTESAEGLIDPIIRWLASASLGG